jgi:hypothetical protein
MTWGDVSATPLLLDPTDTPIDVSKGDGPQFMITELSKKEKIAIELAEKANREKKKKLKERQAQQQATSALLASVTTPNRMNTPGRTPMSKAAQMVAGQVLAAKSKSMDSQLRASYGGSTPMMSGGGSTPFRTPVSTPRRSVTPAVKPLESGASTPARSTPAPAPSVTDNLLNI